MHLTAITNPRRISSLIKRFRERLRSDHVEPERRSEADRAGVAG